MPVHALRRSCAAGLVQLLGALALPAGAADIDSAAIFRNAAHQQTGDATLIDGQAFFTAAVRAGSGTNFDAATLELPDGTTVPMPADTAVDYGHRPPSFPSLADMDTALPVGSYTFTLGNGAGALASTSIDFLGNDYAATPMLTGGSFSALQGMNAAAALSLSLTPMDPTGADESLVFFNVWRRSDGAFAFGVGFLPAATTTVLLPGGTLAAGTAYRFEIDHSRRFLQAANGTTFANLLAFDTRTYGDFTTAAVPEPATWGLMALGLLAVGGAARRRR